jgi:hypothetical protein
MRPATASVRADGLHLSVLMLLGRRLKFARPKFTALALPTTKPLGVFFSIA